MIIRLSTSALVFSQPARLLHDFIKLVKPTASLMKTWSQVQNTSTVLSNSTSPAVLFRQTSLCVEDQVFLFLARVQVGRFTIDLAVTFNVSGLTVSRVVISWGNYLYFTLGRHLIWPSRARIARQMPGWFKELYPNVSVILDCTEVSAETFSSLVLRSEIFSSYKLHTTFKGSFGITSGGAGFFRIGPLLWIDIR